MKKTLAFFIAMIIGSGTVLLTCAQTEKKPSDIKLLIRGDDIASFHAANVACINSYAEGIMRSVEVMVPCPWYPEAVKMMNDHPGLDVGIHLVLTSEWENMKWRPLTGMSSITDSRGYFFPMVWQNDNFPHGSAFRDAEWRLEDVERELRAQIELAKSEINGVSHLSSHMGFTSASPSIDSLVKALAVEYNLDINPDDFAVERLAYSRLENGDLDVRIDSFISSLRRLDAGTYLYIEHPALDTREIESIGHPGYYGVGRDRQMVTDMFTSDRIKKEIQKLGIELISYADLKK